MFQQNILRKVCEVFREFYKNGRFFRRSIVYWMFDLETSRRENTPYKIKLRISLQDLTIVHTICLLGVMRSQIIRG